MPVNYRHYGQLSNGVILEWMTSHTNVIFQPPVGYRAYSGINPFALGLAMYTDLKRICEAPTDEDRVWFPDIAGSPWLPTLDHVMCNFKDEPPRFRCQHIRGRINCQIQAGNDATNQRMQDNLDALTLVASF